MVVVVVVMIGVAVPSNGEIRAQKIRPHSSQFRRWFFVVSGGGGVVFVVGGAAEEDVSRRRRRFFLLRRHEELETGRRFGAHFVVTGLSTRHPAPEGAPQLGRRNVKDVRTCI